jgi:hypothetical protein
MLKRGGVADEDNDVRTTETDVCGSQVRTEELFIWTQYLLSDMTLTPPTEQ